MVALYAAKLFWSVTAYSVDTRCLIDNDQGRGDRGWKLGDVTRAAGGSSGSTRDRGRPRPRWPRGIAFRHDLRERMSVTTWLVIHLTAASALAGVAWVVQLVVYPAFAQVGRAEWAGYHARHTRAITRVVSVPWAVQVVSAVALVLRPPADNVAAAVGLAVLALVPVVATIAAAVPAHQRLTVAEDGASEVRTLLRANVVRCLAWTGSTALAATLLG